MVWGFKMSNINYEEIGGYYGKIIDEIFNCLWEDTPPSYDKENCNWTGYSEEYLNAYGYLQKAEWRLNDINEMKKYWDNEDYVHFGLENLHEVRFRIGEYLEHTSFKFQDWVYDYKKYDKIVIDKYSTLKSERHHGIFKKYADLMCKESVIDSIKFVVTKDFKADIEELLGLINDDEYLEGLSYDELMKFNKRLYRNHNHVNRILLDYYKRKGG